MFVQMFFQAIYCGLSTTEYREFNPDACHLFEKLTKNKVLHITVVSEKLGATYILICL